jgi:ABC-2 type transport system permease protein
MTTATATSSEVRSRSRGGWRIVARKELADHVVSIRFFALVAILAVATASASYVAANALRDVAPDTLGSPDLFLRLFTVSADPVPFAFTAFVGFLAPLLGIAFGFDAVNGERAEGTLPRLVSQPIHRDDVINGKFVAGITVIGLALTTVTLLVAGFGILRLGIVPTPGEIGRVMVWLVVTIVYVGFWLAFATLMSTVTSKAATSALVSIALWVVLTIFAALLVQALAGIIAPLPSGATAQDVLHNAQVEQNLSRLSPVTLFDDATTALLTPQARSVGLVTLTQLDRALSTPLTLNQSILLVWPQIIGIVMLTVLCFGGAYITFLRQEIRA